MPLGDTVSLMVAAVERSSYEVHSSAYKDQTARILLSQGTTVMSWGEVGRIDLQSINSCTTQIYARVEPLEAPESVAPTVNLMLPEWMKDFVYLEKVLAENRRDGTYKNYKVVERKFATEIKSSDTGGLMLGVLFGGVVGAAEAAKANDIRGKKIPYEYQIESGEVKKKIVSFVPVNVGQSVHLVGPDMMPFDAERSENPPILIPSDHSC